MVVTLVFSNLTQVTVTWKEETLNEKMATLGGTLLIDVRAKPTVVLLPMAGGPGLYTKGCCESKLRSSAIPWTPQVPAT